MVYHGPSMGCKTCKRRRKKCDENRPSCYRCTSSNYTCEGYEHDNSLLIRRYEPPEAQNTSPPPLTYQSMALKCTLPPRGTTAPIPSNPSLSDTETEIYSLRAFLYDYCIISADPSLSLGFLHGLEPLLYRLGPQSDLAKACRVVSFASQGSRLNRPSLRSRAILTYNELLVSLAKAIERPKPVMEGNQVVLVPVLLGLYEIILANEEHPGNHSFHAKGITAMFDVEGSPLSIFGAVHLIRSGHPLVLGGKAQDYGMFYAPGITEDANLSLDDLMIAFASLWQKAELFLAKSPKDADQILSLREEVVNLNDALERWQKTRSEKIRPTEIGRVSRERALAAKFGVGYWPGRVDTYYDLYAAGVWNISRTARLLLIFLDLQLRGVQNDEVDHSRELDDASHLIEDMVASIPYHLTEDIYAFVQGSEMSTEIADVGKAVGGLLLMHPIYIASKLSIVPSNVREYMKGCLSWIGTRMGIGQATLFSRAQHIDEDYFAGGSMIVWAGLLV